MKHDARFLPHFGPSGEQRLRNRVRFCVQAREIEDSLAPVARWGANLTLASEAPQVSHTGRLSCCHDGHVVHANALDEASPVGLIKLCEGRINLRLRLRSRRCEL